MRKLGYGGIIGAGNIPSYSAAPGIWTADMAARQNSGGGLQWPGANDPNFSSVVLLMHADELGYPNHGSASVVTPSFAFANSVTSPTHFTTASASFSTSSTSFGIFYGTATAFSMGSGDFTIEFWGYPTTVSVGANVFDLRTAATSICPMIGWNGPGNGVLQYFVNGSNQILSAANALVVNAWQHIAVARASGTTKLFLGGTQVGSSYTDANNYSANGGVNLGNSIPGLPAAPAVGYIAEARITKGVARYTTTFTPPMARFPDY